MKRRTVLAAAVLPPLSGLRQWIHPLMRVNQGEIVGKRVVAVDGRRERELVHLDADSQRVMPDHEALFGGSPGEVSTETARRLRDRYADVVFHVTVAHHETSVGRPDDGSPVEYQTSRVLYSETAVGSHVSFQTSLLRPAALISMSCRADNKESLQHRCQISVEDPTKND